MATKTFFLAMALVFAMLALVPTAVTGCNRFCEDKHGKFYCCETPPPTVPPRPGRCPKVINSFCGQKFSSDFAPPKVCKTDNDCGARHLKCCYDKCIKRTVCKPAQF